MTVEERKAQVEAVRKEKYTSQDIFAEKAGLKKDTYKKFLQGGNSEAETLEKIADALDVSVDFVLGRTNHRHVDDEEIHQQTGLSLKAIENLRSWTKKAKYLGNYRSVWTKTVNVLLENCGLGSVLDELYPYLRIVPSHYEIEYTYHEYIYDEENPEKIIGEDGVAKTLGRYDDDEVSITLDNGTSFLINENFLASAQLNNVTKSIQDLRVKLWNTWKKNHA